MKVSVVIPCHNAGRWIGETLLSVAAQTRAPHEVIVVDDGSTDDSVERVRRSGVDVRLIPAAVRNAAAARNIGIETATGDWIALLDADDLWYPNHLERAAAVLAGTGDVGYRAIYDEVTADGQRRPHAKRQPITETRTGLTHHDYIRFESSELSFGHSSFVLSRDRLREVGGYDPAQVRRHDIDMWLRFIHGRTWTWDAVATMAYRVDTPGSISRSYAECEYYHLRAYARNAPNYPGADMEQLLRKTARRVMTLGFADGSASDYQRARGLAWPYLPVKIRAAYAVAERAPWLFRRLIRAKRAVFAWRTGYRLPELGSTWRPPSAQTP